MADSSSPQRFWSRLRERLLGGPNRLGLWTLPVFVAVGLAGAVLAGSLAVVYYSQQVDDLRSQTRSARDTAEAAREDIEAARDDALEQVSEQVEQVQELLTRQLPVEDASVLGVVVIRAVDDVPVQPQPQQSPSPQPSPEPGGGSEPSGAPDAQQPVAQEQQSGEQEPGEQQPEQQPEPQPQTRRVVRGVGLGFPVARDQSVTFLATTYALVADRDSPGGVRETVEVQTPDGPTRGVVHSWDEGRDLALIRAEIGPVEIPEWQPQEEELVQGERVVAVGRTPTFETVAVTGLVAFIDPAVFITDLPDIGFMQGAPVVDNSGRIVGVYATRYLPFGAAAGEGQSIVPVRILCERLLRNCDATSADSAGGGGDQG